MPIEIAAARGERFPDEKSGEKNSAKETPAKTGDRASLSTNVVQAAESLPESKNSPSDGAKDKTYHDARTTITLGAGESQDVVLRCPFDPEIVTVDPDALVLQLERKLAIFRF